MDGVSIVNVVGGGSVHRELDLRQLAQDFPHDVEYEPESFAAAVIRYDSPKGAVMLYTSGKFSLAGSRSPEEIREVNELFLDNLEQMLGGSLTRTDFEIRYMVGSGDLGRELDLNQLAIGLGSDHTEYEPEQFPGLFYKPPKAGYFCSIFRTGKIVISGARTEQELVNIFDELKETVEGLIQSDGDDSPEA